MARKNRRRTISNNEALEDADAITEDTIEFSPEIYPLHRYLEELFHRRETKRENAIKSIIHYLIYRVENEFVEKNFATLLYRFLFSMKKGSLQEIHFASEAIGLLSIITHHEDNAHEVYEESVPLLTEILKSKPQIRMKISCLEALAVVTLFGAKNMDETESTMQVLWEFIIPKSDPDVVERNFSAEVLDAAISSWSLLLSSTDQRRLSYRYWKRAISCFLDLLDSNNEAVCEAAGEALALIFEAGSIEKFSSKHESDGSSSAPEASSYGIHEQLVKEKVLEKLVQRFVTNENSAESDVIRFFQDGSCPKIDVKIKEHDLTSSWSRKIQLNFFVRFLRGKGFKQHMLENEVLQDFFEFKPKQRNSPDAKLYVPLIDEVKIYLYLPPEKTNLTNLTSEQIKKMRVARLYDIKKAKTKLLNKHRALAKNRDQDNIFGC